MSLAAVKKNPQVGQWLNRHLFLIALEAGRLTIKVLADLAPGESSLPNLHALNCKLHYVPF